MVLQSQGGIPVARALPKAHSTYEPAILPFLRPYSPISRRIFLISVLPKAASARMTAEMYPHRLVYNLKSFNVAICDEIINISEHLILQASDSSKLHYHVLSQTSPMPVSFPSSSAEDVIAIICVKHNDRHEPQENKTSC
jgi:hypothetical protein